MIIVVTGSVGTGKTTIAKNLAKRLKFIYLDVNSTLDEYNLKSKYIKKFDAYEVDVSKLNKVLIKIIKDNKNLVIDSHLSHYLPSSLVDYCIVCKCDIKFLNNRLVNRKYTKIKIRENLDSEIFDVCLIEALEKKHNVIVLDTTNKTVRNCVNELIKKIK